MGALSNHMVVSSINLIERNLTKDSGFKKLRRKLSFLMIESFQNIIRYGDEPANKELRYRKELFVVRNIGGTFYIGSSNLIENKKIDFVNAKLHEVNKLDASDLNQLYRKILTNNEFTKAGGAGLGFIEMARKTQQKLQFDFVKLDEEYSYFYLLIKVKCESAEPDDDLKMDIEWFKNFHTLACDEDIVMMHKGNFSPIVLDPVIDMVENNIKSKAINVQKLAFHVVLESLQNLSNHSLEFNDEKEAIFLISKKNKKHIISTGNFIKTSKIKLLKEQLDQIKNSSMIELKRNFEEASNKKNPDEKQKTGLGLLQIAIESNNKLAYNFIKINEKVSFYTFNVLV